MIPLSAVKTAAEILGIAVPALVEGLKAIKCIVEECDVTLDPATSPDLLSQSLKNRTDLARRATGTDRAAIDAAFRSDADELLGDPRAR